MAIGQRVRNLDWEERTSGRSTYTGDVRLDGLLFARVLRSPHAHALLVDVDTSRAERMQGVAAVVTGADFGDVTYIHHGGPLADRPPMTRDRVRYVGQEVAAVAAETPEQAERALERIRVTYRVLPSATTVEQALATGAPLIHPQRGDSNVSVTHRRRYGAPPDPRPDDIRVRARYRFGRQTHACMEPMSTVASWDAAAERLHIWTSTQAPYFIRKEVAHVLGLDIGQVIAHEVAVGGGFGAKSKISESEVLAARLSMKANRPVRLVLDRGEEFATTKCRHAFDIDLQTTTSPDGTLRRRDAVLTVDNGAYNHSGPSVMGYGELLLGSQYRTEGVGIDGRLVYTNKHPGGQFRGYGAPQVTFAVESAMDELADRLGMDPIDLRIRNANETGDVTHAGWRLLSAGMVECLEAVREAIGWDEKRALAGSGRGVGVAATLHVTGARVYEGAERSSAGIDVGLDGSILVRFGGADAGTWQKTILAQIAATELGADPAAVHVLSTETDQTPLDFGSWSSRGTYMSGHAVRKAARAAADRLRGLAAAKFDVDAASVTLSEGRAQVDGRQVDIGELVGLSDQVDGALRVQEEFLATDADAYDPKTGIANLSPTYSFAAQAVEVEVDRRTGRVRVVDVVAAHDSGTAINPTALESQIIGGVVMGLGAALGEELHYEDGRMVTPAYLHYPLPRAADVPRIRPIVVEKHDPSGPYGAKGVGEIGLVPTAAAVANAVAHATGVRVRELPITPDKVLSGMAARGPHGRRHRPIWRRPRRWWIAAMRWAYPRGLHAVLHRYGTKLSRPPGPSGVDELVAVSDLDQAIAALARDRTALPLAGGTDVLPALRQGIVRGGPLIDLAEVAGLDAVAQSAGGDLVIGAGVRLADLARHPLTAEDTALRATIAGIASAQIREMATVGGNLCQEKRCWFFRNGFNCYKRGGVTSPCYAVMGDHRFHHAALGAHRCQAVTPSDLATTLTALDTTVAIRGSQGRRILPLGEFYVGPGETALREAELVESVTVPAAARRRVTVFEKLGLWEGDFAVVSACASLALDPSGPVLESRLVLGALGPVPYRAQASERFLRGRRLDPQTIRRAGALAVRDGHPLRRNAWKLEATSGLLERCLEMTRS